MNKYLNIGLIRSFTIFLKSENDIVEILEFLQERIDLNLFTMTKIDNYIYFELDRKIINDNFLDLLKEFKLKNIFITDCLDYNIKILEDSKSSNIDLLLKKCDDLFIDRFSFLDSNNFTNDLYNIEIDFYTIFFCNYHKSTDFYKLISLISDLLTNSISNILSGSFCIGING